jgi:hypothetical protein
MQRDGRYLKKLTSLVQETTEAHVFGTGSGRFRQATGRYTLPANKQASWDDFRALSVMKTLDRPWSDREAH